MIDTNKAVAAVLAVTFINGFFSTNMFESYKNMYSGKIERLETENHELRTELEHYNEYGIVVDVTMDQPVYHKQIEHQTLLLMALRFVLVKHQIISLLLCLVTY